MVKQKKPHQPIKGAKKMLRTDIHMIFNIGITLYFGAVR